MKSMTDELPKPAEIAGYDIILFSKQRFDKEARNNVAGEAGLQTSNDAHDTSQYIGLEAILCHKSVSAVLTLSQLLDCLIVSLLIVWVSFPR